MNKVFKLFAFIAIITMAGSVNAQNTKIGHINSSELLSVMPGKDTVEAKLQEYEASLKSQVQSMYVEYQNKVQEYQANVSTFSELIRKTKEEEIGGLEQRIMAFEQNMQQDFQMKRAELFNPLLEKAQDAINIVAKENGFTYVMDSGTGSVIYFDGGIDILPLVKKKLGIQ
ncbi:MAG: OmpH family outer membrane protein [Bacteroidales bacterium]|nr:OmpH family outer membrane protein [Bacteroidales bacterium]